MSPALVDDPALVTPGWLTEVLREAGAIDGAVRVVDAEPTVVGTGQVGANVRFVLTYAGDGPGGPESVVCKFASRDPQSAAAGVATRTYETEVAFYREIAHTVAVSRPRCYLAALEPGTARVVLVLEDLAPAVPGDQIAGCTVAEATLAVDEAVQLHAPRWGDPSLRRIGWLDPAGTLEGMAAMVDGLWPLFVERYRDALGPVTLDAGAHLRAAIEAQRSDTRSPRTLVHRDFRLDNLLFGTAAGGRAVAVVDWQTVQLGVGPSDVAYFLGSAFAPEVRRGCEHELVQRYHRGLVDDHGVADYSFERCWDDYVRSSYASLIMAVFASAFVGRTERGDAMFVAMAERSAHMAADLDAAARLDDP